MTICVAIRVNDGIVFAADSATSITVAREDGTTDIVNVYLHGNKIFNLYKGLPIVAMTCGMGSFGSEAIGSLAKEFRFHLKSGMYKDRFDPKSYTISDLVNLADEYFLKTKFQSLSPIPKGDFEFWIAGYDSGLEHNYSLWKLRISNGDCLPPHLESGPGECGIDVGGAPDPLYRLILGYTPAVLDGIYDVLTTQEGKEHDAAVDLIHRFVPAIRERTEATLTIPAMPLQTAIGLADFLVDTTKRYYKFLPGADIVGGDTDIAVVTRYEGFKWIQRKHFYPSDLNPMESGHA